MKNTQKHQSETITAWALTILQSKKETSELDIHAINEMVKKLADGFKEREEKAEALDEYLEIYDVPEFVFQHSEDDPKLQHLNRRIKELKPGFQKLLYFIAKGFDPENITQSLGYSDQSEYWSKRKQCLVEFSGSDEEMSGELKSNLIKVHDKYSQLRDSFMSITDELSIEKAKKTSIKSWVITGLATALILTLFFLLVYPRIIQKDFEVLFDYAVEKSGFVMTIDSTDLLDDMIFDEEEYTPESYWLLALKSLQTSDSESCRDNLKALKSSDKIMFNERGRYIYRRLR